MQADHDIQSLIAWYRRSARSMPWRKTRDPYRIWLSEIMLQQTRVEQAIPYYERFTERFPDVQALALAERDEVLKLWEGLGYYSRARNLHKAAGQIVDRHDGTFPDSYDELIALQGIGPYTAAAVMSIAFDRPHAVVDGNVIRVISRLFAIDDDVRTSGIQKEIGDLAHRLLDRKHPADHNQAMMELGATICTPIQPQCHSCPLQESCVAYHEHRTAELPYKSPAKKRPHHQIAVGVIRDDHDRVLIARRPDEAMLGGLWEFPGGKRENGEALTETVQRELFEELGADVTVDREPFEVIHHAYSHFTITLHAFFAHLRKGSNPPRPHNGEPLRWVQPSDLDDYAFPKANRKITDTLVKYRA